MPFGVSSSALIAGPPSPLNPAVPVPATTWRVPLGNRRRIWFVPWLAIRRSPFGAIAKASGRSSNEAGVGTTVVGVDEATVVGVVGCVNELVDGVVLFVGEPAVSGLTQPAGGLDVPVWPGMSTVPAQPK